MKKIVSSFILLFVLSANCPLYAFDFSFFNKDNPQREIKKVLKKHNKAMANHNIDLVQSYYDENYKSADGFNLEDMKSMLEKTQQAYTNIKYKTKINNITTYDNWALAQMSDETYAKVYLDKDKKNKEKAGTLRGKSSYLMYFKKDKDKWKIVADEILMEETSLKYGVAKKIDMELETPIFIENDKNYDISLKMPNKPEDIIALASISREEITYPPADYNEKFRKIPETGDLERYVKANNKNLNEYALASVGLTKVSINEEITKAKIEILGIAYIMKRINMNKNSISNKNIAEKK